MPKFSIMPTSVQKEEPVARVQATDDSLIQDRQPGDLSTPGLSSDLENKFSNTPDIFTPKLGMNSPWTQPTQTAAASTVA